MPVTVREVIFVVFGLESRKRDLTLGFFRCLLVRAILCLRPCSLLLPSTSNHLLFSFSWRCFPLGSSPFHLCPCPPFLLGLGCGLPSLPPSPRDPVPNPFRPRQSSPSRSHPLPQILSPVLYANRESPTTESRIALASCPPSVSLQLDSLYPTLSILPGTSRRIRPGFSPLSHGHSTSSSAHPNRPRDL